MSRSVFPHKAIQPCLPKPAKEPPAGPDWIHEIKHDGFRILARRNAKDVWLYTRNGSDFADRFPRIVEAVKSLPVRSCFIDGEAIVVDASGLAVFNLLRSWRHNHVAMTVCFRSDRTGRQEPAPDADRGNLLYRDHDGIAFNKHYDYDGAVVYKHACALGCEGIVSKRLGSTYRSGRVNDWLKIKNVAAPALEREVGENWR
jgi:ATP-dependent DNA ligase